MTTYTVREVVLSGQPLTAQTLPAIIQANDPADGSTLAGLLLVDPSILLIVWAHT